MKKLALMSIKTKHSQKIFSGTKIWEFRKAPPKLKEGESLEIVVYSSQVERAIVGKFSVERIVSSKLEELMQETGYGKDMDALEWFRSYYSNKELCSAIKISDPVLFETPITLAMIKKEIPSFCPPQNFVYIREDSDIGMLIQKHERSM